MGLKSWLAGTSIAKYLTMPFSWFNEISAGDTTLVAAYFTGVKILSENMAKMHPQVLDKENKVMENHPLTPLFSHHPNNYTNRQKFWKVAEAKRVNQGDCYAYISRERGKATGLHLLTKESIIGAKLDTSGRLFYEVNFGKTSLSPFTGIEQIRDEDLLHFTFGQVDGLFGTSALEILALQTSIMARAQRTLDAFYKNNATSSLAIETTIDRASIMGKMNDANADFIEEYVGADNSGKPIRLPPNTKVVPIGQKFADAQVIETQRFAREEIANLFGIPKSMFDATDNNESIEQQTRMFLAFTLTPIIEAYIAELEFKLLTAEEKKAGVHIEYNIEKLIETDIKTKAEIITMQVTKGIMSPNEGAKAMGNDVIDGIYGDFHWTQTQNQPIEYYDQWGASSQVDEDKNSDNNDKLKSEIDESQED